MSKKYFFGWGNWKWFIRNLVAMWSAGESYFAKKRVESNIAFIVYLYMNIHFFIIHCQTMTTVEIVMLTAPVAVVAGYTVNQIQKEKKESQDGNPS